MGLPALPERPGPKDKPVARAEGVLHLAASLGAPDPAVVNAVRLFHAAGRSQGLPPDVRAGQPVPPAAAVGLLDTEHLRASLPVVVLGDGRDVVPMLRFLEAAADAAQKTGASTTAVRQVLPHFTSAADAWLQGHKAYATLGELLDAVGRGFIATVDTSGKGALRLREEWASFCATLPAREHVVGWGPETLPVLALLAEQDRHRPARQAYLTEVRTLARALSDMLHAEKARTSSDATVPALGAMASSFMEPSALAAAQPASRGPVGMDPTHKASVEKALARLEEHLARADAMPDVVVLRPQGSPLGSALPAAVVREVPRPLEAARTLYDELAAQANEVLRATRLARLALASQYDPTIHDALMAHVNVATATEGERFALPAIMVLETGEQVRRGGVDVLGDVLAGRRPIHVVVAETCAPDDIHPEGRPGSLADVALAYREAFVLSATLANPIHLNTGLRALASRLRPGVVVVAVPGTATPVAPALWATLAWEARVTPCFKYDPGAGETWAERFDVSGNPAVDKDVFSYARVVDGSPSPVELPLSYAALALLSPAWRQHVWALPANAWDKDLVELHAGLSNGKETRIPFTWAVDEAGTLLRAVLTDTLLAAVEDRVRAWRLLRELGGVENSHARRAVEAARAEAAKQALGARLDLESNHAAALAELRKNAAADTLDRLVSVLLNLDTVVVPSPATPKAAPAVTAPAAPSPAPAPNGPPKAAAAPEAASEDPYTDSALCTTCNECTQINNRLFKYNANKQAFIADAAAGTYAQLVKAAEKCPARCIHVGTPRPGDATANDALVARAKAFR